MGLLLYRFGMRTARRHPIRVVTVTAALLLVLVGCTQPSPEPTPTPSPAPNPVFASDEEALAAAEKAYADYLAMSDLIAQEGGAHPERMEEVATGEALTDGIADAARYEESGYFGVGVSKFDRMSVQSRTDGPPPTLRTYVCLDVSGTKIVDSSGTTVVETPGSPRTPLEVSFERVERGGSWLVSDSVLWEGANFC
ncbi:hypothetical protein [Planctomonas deserti]|uniref:hypothetical protein n=1 Tax=Planctomonas deserti TaxID=2144185 RepID=UPI000D3B44F9|nr:hypothetical protein [Planctomonas deserti]